MEREHILKKEWDTISDPGALLRALAATCRALADADAFRRRADLWLNRRRFEREVIPALVERWCLETGRDGHEFPWTEDFLVHCCSASAGDAARALALSDRSPGWRAVADQRALVRAVIRLYEEVDARCGEPAAEIWNTNRRYFLLHARPRLAAMWAEETARDPDELPWTDDFLVKSWVDWRKALKHVRPQIRERAGMPPAPVPVGA